VLNADLALASSLVPIGCEPLVLTPEDMVSSPTLVTQVGPGRCHWLARRDSDPLIGWAWVVR
jgi:hypothetical protein